MSEPRKDRDVKTNKPHAPRPDAAAASVPQAPNPVPATVRCAGILACLEALVSFAYAAILLYRQARGEHDAAIVSEPGSNTSWVAMGTAIFFLIVFGGIFAGGVGLARGTHRFGRGMIIILQVILLPIAFSMFGVGNWALGLVTAALAVATLALSFSPSAIDWTARAFGGTRKR